MDFRHSDNLGASANLDFVQVLVDIVHHSLSFRVEFSFQVRSIFLRRAARNFLGSRRCLQTFSRVGKDGTIQVKLGEYFILMYIF
jgi:hypothetical protein